MPEYAKCECYACHILLPKPDAYQLTIQRERGRSGPSARFSGRNTSFSTGRSYYTNKDVWLCPSCYAAYHKRQSRQKAQLIAAAAILGVLILVLSVIPQERPSDASSPRSNVGAVASGETQDQTVSFVVVEDTKQNSSPLDEIRQIQSRLAELNYPIGLPDGVWGPRSRTALRLFKAANGLPVDDVWDDATRARLFSGVAARAPLPAAKAQ